MLDHVERAPVGVLKVAHDGTVRALNRTAEDLLDVVASSASGEPIATVFPDSVQARVPAAFDASPVSEASFEEYYPDIDRWLSVSPVATEDAVFVYLQDQSDRHATERELSATTTELRRSTLTNELIADLLTALANASDRTEIASTICDQLDDADGYQVAWVGEREIGAEHLVVRASTGTTNRTLECIQTQLDAGDPVPESRAIESGGVEVVQPLGEDESVPDSIRRAAFADGLQSLLAVPLTYGSSVYGVVGIYATDRGAFSARERSSFATVGEMAGFAINAIRNRTLLRSNAVAELVFELPADGAPLTVAASDAAVELTVDGLVRRGEELLCYLAVDGNSPASVLDSLESSQAVGTTRIVSSRADAGSIEVALQQTTPMGLLLSEGATVRSATFRADGGRIAAELAPDAELRRIAEAVTNRYDADVVSKREHERDAESVTDFRAALTDRLTDHQTEALRTAYLADYFESPRGSTAEEVASALGITGPTLLHHLRAAQRKLLAEFFDRRDR